MTRNNNKLNKAISFVIPVMDETDSLKVTVECIQEMATEQLKEIIIVMSPKTTKDAHNMAGILQNSFDDVVLFKQKLPGLGGALRESFLLAKGEYVMLMASDLETNPKDLPKFIQKMSEGRWDIVCGSRWLEKGTFQGYSPIKYYLNWLFQKLLSLMYGSSLSDFTFGYRLYKKSFLLGHNWQELYHSFLLECILRPLLRGASVTEVSCSWKSRDEGRSHGTKLMLLSYVIMAIKTRFSNINLFSFKN